MHSASLMRIKPTSYHEYSHSQLVLGKQPNIFHFRVFGCAVHVSIAPPQCTKMGPQCRLRIYVGFDSPSIIRYLEPLTGDVFRARFENFHFNEIVFPPLLQEITWNASILSHFDHRTNQCELEVQRIIHLYNLANQLSDAFVDAKKVTKSHIPVVNALARIEVPQGQKENESKPLLKYGRPIGLKDLAPQKRRTKANQNALVEEHDEQRTPVEAHIEQQTLEKVKNEQISPKDANMPENFEISINYVHNRENGI